MADPAAQPAHPAARRPEPPRARFPTVPVVSPSTMRGRQQPNERAYTFAHRQRLLRAIEVYLRWCYRQKTAARTSELAARLGVLPQYLSWIAPVILGKPLLVVLREKQLQEAERLLRHTPLSVKEIALRSAFGTPSTLQRWFREKHGIAPAAFRELKK